MNKIIIHICNTITFFHLNLPVIEVSSYVCPTEINSNHDRKPIDRTSNVMMADRNRTYACDVTIDAEDVKKQNPAETMNDRDRSARTEADLVDVSKVKTDEADRATKMDKFAPDQVEKTKEWTNDDWVDTIDWQKCWRSFDDVSPDWTKAVGGDANSVCVAEMWME